MFNFITLSENVYNRIPNGLLRFLNFTFQLRCSECGRDAAPFRHIIYPRGWRICHNCKVDKRSTR